MAVNIPLDGATIELIKKGLLTSNEIETLKNQFQEALNTFSLTLSQAQKDEVLNIVNTNIDNSKLLTVDSATTIIQDALADYLTEDEIKNIINSSLAGVSSNINYNIPSITTKMLTDGLTAGTIKFGDVVYVNDSDPKVIVYVKSDGSLNTLPYIYPDGVEPYIDPELLFALLTDHIENDKGYWSKLQEVLNQLTALQALVTQNSSNINSLEARIATLEGATYEAPPEYNMSLPTVLKTPPLIGALFIEIGGINLIGDGYTILLDGLIVIDGAAAIGLLTPTWIAKNGEKLDPLNPLAVLTIIGGGNSGQFPVKAGDIITESGMGNITFYPEIK